MGVWQGSGQQRKEPVLVHFTKGEKKDLKKLAKSAGVSMQEYLRCRAFGKPLEAAKEAEPSASYQNAKEESVGVV